MRILFSAFACDPNQGSEPGAGWAWATELARSGHELLLVTRERNRAAIEDFITNYPQANIRFLFEDVRRVPQNIKGLGIYPYYFAWQLKLYLRAKELFDLNQIDCIHHMTYGSYRTPFFLSFLNKPSIFGPVAGGEVIPIRLTKGMSSSARVREGVRMLLNVVGFFNPVTRRIWKQATLILTTTDQTRKIVPRRHQQKTRLLLAVTSPTSTRSRPTEKIFEEGRLQLLFVARLLEWKGLHLAIRALSIARRANPRITLSIVGSGPAEAKIRLLIRDEGVEDAVEWVPRVPRNEVMHIYDRHDLLLFPSLRDAGGMVILEAFSRGVPVLCLQLPGTKGLVDSSCGITIPIEGETIGSITNHIAASLLSFSTLELAERNALRESAYLRAEEFTARKVVGRAYSWFDELSERPS